MKKTILPLLVVAVVVSGCAQPMIQDQNKCRVEAAKLQYLKMGHNVTARSGTDQEYSDSLMAVRVQAAKLQRICTGGTKWWDF